MAYQGPPTNGAPGPPPNQAAPSPQRQHSTEIRQPEMKSIEQTVYEFYDSERFYVEDVLRRGIEHYQRRLEVHEEKQNKIINKKDINAIFKSYNILYPHHKNFLENIIKLAIKGGVPAIRGTYTSASLRKQNIPSPSPSRARVCLWPAPTSHLFS